MFGNDIWIVSDRLRDFLEREAPDCAEFLDVNIVGPQRQSLYKNYWAVNWLHAWDCQPDKDWPQFDVALIPEDGVIGVIAGRGWAISGAVIARDHLCKRMKEANFIGLRFEKAKVMTSGKTKAVRKNPTTGKRETTELRFLPHSPHFDVDAYLASGQGANDPTGTPNSSAFHEYVTMHSAFGGVDPRTIRKFLASGADPNVGHGPNVSPLLVVLQPKSPALLRLLHEHGADVNVAIATSGHTPLMAACGTSSPAAVKTLLELGADPAARDFAGRTALDQVLEALERATPSESKRLNEIRRLLEMHSARKSATTASKSRQSKKPAKRSKSTSHAKQKAGGKARR